MKKTISAPCAGPRPLSCVVSACGKTWFLQSLTGRPQTLILSRRASAVSKDGRRLPASEKASFDTPPSAVTQDEEGGGGGACPERSRGTATQGEGCRGTAEPAPGEVEGPLLRVRRSGGLLGMSDVGADLRVRQLARTRTRKTGAHTGAPLRQTIQSGIFQHPLQGLLKKPLKKVHRKPHRGEGIPIIELFAVGTGLRACPDEGQPRRVVPTTANPPLSDFFNNPLQGGSDSFLSRLSAMLFKSEVRSRGGGGQFRARKGFSTTTEAAG